MALPYPWYLDLSCGNSPWSLFHERNKRKCDLRLDVAIHRKSLVGLLFGEGYPTPLLLED